MLYRCDICVLSISAASRSVAALSAMPYRFGQISFPHGVDGRVGFGGTGFGLIVSQLGSLNTGPGFGDGTGFGAAVAGGFTSTAGDADELPFGAGADGDGDPLGGEGTADSPGPGAADTDGIGNAVGFAVASDAAGVTAGPFVAGHIITSRSTAATTTALPTPTSIISRFPAL
jgi:hypothetical protein